MPMATDESGGRPNLQTAREPVAPADGGTKGSSGDQALMDALFIVGVAWVILILLVISLRRYNI